MKNTKIRSWNKFENQFFYFQNGRYFKDSDCKECVSERICSEFIWRNAEWCTNLKDNKGKGLYEGDIISDMEDEPMVLPVIYDNEFAQFAVDISFNKDGSSIEDIPTCYENGFEIIGNIFENPELLTKNKT